jgi:hypothetical protein
MKLQTLISRLKPKAKSLKKMKQTITILHK